jgi:hypothetical protein
MWIEFNTRVHKLGLIEEFSTVNRGSDLIATLVGDGLMY